MKKRSVHVGLVHSPGSVLIMPRSLAAHLLLVISERSLSVSLMSQWVRQGSRREVLLGDLLFPQADPQCQAQSQRSQIRKWRRLRRTRRGDRFFIRRLVFIGKPIH